MSSLDERRGPQRPTTTTPPRARGSVRRTSNIDMRWPEGVRGPLRLAGRARDIRTGPDGVSVTLAERAVDAVVDFLDGRLLRRIETRPEVTEVTRLVGAVSGPGFRSRLDAALPHERDTCDPLYSLLDDFPVATMIAGQAISVAHRPDEDYWASRGEGRDLKATLARADVCAGWASDATIMRHLATEQRIPLAVGPTAPVIEADDPQGWHPLAPLEPTTMRRRRRIDVRPGAPGELVVDAMFRDSFVEPTGRETVIHEYTLDVRIDRSRLVVSDIEAQVRVLPWQECPAAAASAGRLRGRPVTDLRASVRGDLIGTSTCTHLNDALRALQDVAGLVAALQGPDGNGRPA